MALEAYEEEKSHPIRNDIKADLFHLKSDIKWTLNVYFAHTCLNFTKDFASMHANALKNWNYSFNLQIRMLSNYLENFY